MISSVDHLKLLPNFDFSELTDVQLQQLLEGAEAMVKSFCGRNFEEQEYTEYFDADRLDFLLYEWPVNMGDDDIDAPQISYDATGYYGQGEDAFAVATLLTLGSDYVILPRQPGILRMLSGATWSGFGCVNLGGHGYDFARGGQVHGLGALKAVYTAGYSEANMPEDLKLAVDMVAAYNRRTAALGGSTSGGTISAEQLGQYRVSFGQSSSKSNSGSIGTNNKIGPDLGGVSGILAKYKKYVVA